MPDPEGLEGRIDTYFEMAIMMARRKALSGKPGSWASIGARAEQAADRWRKTQACHPGLHARFLEFQIWGEILGACVLPDRHQTLASALHQIGVEEARSDLTVIEFLLDVICPEQPPSVVVPPRPQPALQEFAVLRQLKDAEERGTATALDSAVRATVALAESSEGTGASHRRCEPCPTLTTGWVLTRALWETMPRPYRAGLTCLVQRQFITAYAPDAPEPKFLHEAPAFPLSKDDDARWRFNPTWQFIPVTQRDEDPLDAGPAPWLIEDLEALVRQGVKDAISKRQEADRRLELLAAGQPLS